MNRGGRQGSVMELERRAQQIKEVVRASAALRADMPPEAICALVAQTIHNTLGFRAAVVNLIVPGNRYFKIVAAAGISEAERQRLINDPPPVDHIISLMRPDFQVARTRSYFIGHEHKYLLEGAGGITLLTPSLPNTPHGPNAWHPDDVFFVPLVSFRETRLLGIISLDLPEDGKIPSFDTVEVIELLANQAATALETARLFQERDLERQALHYGLEELLAHLERMRQRDLSARAHLHSTALTHVESALNDVSETLGNVLADVRDGGTVVQRQANEMRDAASQLVNGAQLQAEQIQTASQAIQYTSEQMRQIVGRAADSRAIAEEANTFSIEGREAAEHAGEGMSAVREITLQAARRMKRLGESSQEIGNVIQLVSEFAGQTHLLALNAAIEAANAGEHGSGFAIVAREIRNLAQNSNDATKQIQARIKGIQNETNQVAVTIEYATQQVAELSDLVTRSSTALHAIDTVIQEIIKQLATMHRTAETQARATATVSGTMNTIAGITGATWQSAENMRASMDQLAELASILQAKIEMFRLNERPQIVPASSSVSIPLQSSGVISGLTSPRITSTTPASSFPAASFPATSQPPAPSPASSSPASSSPASSYPANPFAGAPIADPFAASAPATGAKGPAMSDMDLQPTIPMPTVHTQPQPQPTTAPYRESAQLDDAPAPAPIFPVSNSPLTPMRLAALGDDANGNAPPAHEAENTPTDAADTATDSVPAQESEQEQEPEPDATAAETSAPAAGAQPAPETVKLPAREPVAEPAADPLSDPQPAPASADTSAAADAGTGAPADDPA